MLESQYSAVMLTIGSIVARILLLVKVIVSCCRNFAAVPRFAFPRSFLRQDDKIDAFLQHHTLAAKQAYTFVQQRRPSAAFLFFVAAAFLILSACQSANQPDANALFHQKDSTETNIGFINKLPENDHLTIASYHYYYNGAGVAAGDFNNDGLQDLFFVSNRGKNKLYLNKGKTGAEGFNFKDVSAAAGIEGKSDFQTGVSVADVNGDGWLDIHVCAVRGHKGLEGTNELYLNQGINAAGEISFKEEAAAWGLDFKGHSTQAAFFDYDRDGDLDMYLLNHSVRNPQNFGRASMRSVRDPMAGDRLYQNQIISQDTLADQQTRAVFKDVSESAGIFQATMGFGLGVVVADLNNDGWDDLYIGNDFHEDDYYYINKGDGTFKESLREHFRHVSRFTMGCDGADINNDGLPDLMTMDMYPEDELVIKTTLGDESYSNMLQKSSYGYFNQYTRNCLQLNIGGQKFSDIGVMAGVDATDWSWSTLMADFDGDGYKDIFMANGIIGRQNDLDFTRFLSNSVQYLEPGVRTIEQQVVDTMPAGRVPNYLYQGSKSLKFKDKSAEWGFTQPSFSNGAVYADLDADGDLDLVTNNLNEPAGIFENRAEALFKHNYLKVKFKGNGPNGFGVGAKVYIKHRGVLQFQQLIPARGFLSSVAPELVFGLGNQTVLDTVLVVWPNQKSELKKGVPVNQTLVFAQADAAEEAISHMQWLFPEPAPFLEEATTNKGVDFVHQENRFFDFYRESLMPFLLSTEGPKLAVADVNGDRLDDFWVGGASGQAGKLFIQQPGERFVASSAATFEADGVYEDVDAAFFDADGDGNLDLYVVSGGNELSGEQLADRLYLNSGNGSFSRAQDKLPVMQDNKSCVRPFDFDQDGDIDLFVGGRVVTSQYGITPNSYLLINDGSGNFKNQTALLAPTLRKAGMVTDALWSDYDQDGDRDLIVVGDWMPVKVFENKNNKLAEVKSVAGLEQSNGFWQTIQAADVDGDGDMDFMVGNLGTNTKLRNKEGAVLQLYIKDIDQNSKLEHILAYQLGDDWYPLAGKDELGKQLPLVNKKFNDYRGFAGKTLQEVFDNKELEGAQNLFVNRFESIYLENLGNKQFKQHLLPEEAQVSKVYALHVKDADQDGNLDVLMGGNLWGVSPYQGRYDASYGLMLKGNGKGGFVPVSPTACGFLLEGEVRDIRTLDTPGGALILVARNNMPLQIFKSKGTSSANPLLSLKARVSP